LDTFKKYGINLKTEVVLEDSSARSGVGISGRADAITWDNDGNVIIWDIKTTAREDVSTATKVYRYLQLLTYK